MTFLRAWLFNIIFAVWTIIIGITLPFLYFGPYRYFRFMTRLWCKGGLFLAKIICGIHSEIIGIENIPKGACLLACKHQSMWETIMFCAHFDDPVYVLKQELLWIPFYGWAFWKLPRISINRAAGLKSLKNMIVQAGPFVKQGKQIMIFPEGTRHPYGTKTEYLPGVYVLFNKTGIPAVPIAVNSGKHWGKKLSHRMSGMITMSILPPIAPGLDKNEFMDRLKSDIETECGKL